MSLTLVSSSDDRTLAIRDHLPTVVASAVGCWSRKAPSSMRWSGSIRGGSDYGLDVWHGKKVLSILWSDQGHFEVTIFVRGSWEDEALKL